MKWFKYSRYISNISVTWRSSSDTNRSRRLSQNSLTFDYNNFRLGKIQTIFAIRLPNLNASFSSTKCLILSTIWHVDSKIIFLLSDSIFCILRQRQILFTFCLKLQWLRSKPSKVVVWHFLLLLWARKNIFGWCKLGRFLKYPLLYLRNNLIEGFLCVVTYNSKILLFNCCWGKYIFTVLVILQQGTFLIKLMK